MSIFNFFLKLSGFKKKNVKRNCTERIDKKYVYEIHIEYFKRYCILFLSEYLLLQIFLFVAFSRQI